MEEIEAYLASQPKKKLVEMRELHRWFLEELAGGRLWFADGRDETGKVVSNPNIGYGCYTIKYANGTTKEFFRVGLSGNTSGISVYVMGLEDKDYLKNTFGNRMGKASVTGYCIKFKSTRDIDVDVLMEAVKYGLDLDR